MNAPAELNADCRELEELFDSVVQAGGAGAAAPEPASPHSSDTCPADKVINRVGQLTRQLHDTLCELGYDRQLQSAATIIPDARQRLAYVATLTEQAASRALNAIEAAKPIQDRLAEDAGELAARWDSLYRGELDVEQFKALAAASREFLKDAPNRARATAEQLHEIMMAQDFQDLTGQVIKKITDLAQHLENQLLALLVENAPAQKRAEASGLLNGPVVDGSGRNDVVTGQAQVDELLESLGF